MDIDGTITENGGGRIHLGALSALRYLKNQGHYVIFVTGRSSLEAYMLAVFGGTTKVSVGENGGCITTGDYQHELLGDINECKAALQIIKTKVANVQEKPVFPRMTEVVLERTFDINLAKKIIQENKMSVSIADSQYAIHINSKGVNKGVGFKKVMEQLEIDSSDVIAIGDSITDVALFEVAGTSIAVGNADDYVKSKATMTAAANAGDGVIETLNTLAVKNYEA